MIKSRVIDIKHKHHCQNMRKRMNIDKQQVDKNLRITTMDVGNETWIPLPRTIELETFIRKLLVNINERAQRLKNDKIGPLHLKSLQEAYRDMDADLRTQAMHLRSNRLPYSTINANVARVNEYFKCTTTKHDEVKEYFRQHVPDVSPIVIAFCPFIGYFHSRFKQLDAIEISPTECGSCNANPCVCKPKDEKGYLRYFLCWKR